MNSHCDQITQLTAFLTFHCPVVVEDELPSEEAVNLVCSPPVQLWDFWEFIPCLQLILVCSVLSLAVVRPSVCPIDSVACVGGGYASFRVVAGRHQIGNLNSINHQPVRNKAGKIRLLNVVVVAGLNWTPCHLHYHRRAGNGIWIVVPSVQYSHVQGRFALSQGQTDKWLWEISPSRLETQPLKLNYLKPEKCFNSSGGDFREKERKERTTE